MSIPCDGSLRAIVPFAGKGVERNVSAVMDCGVMTTRLSLKASAYF